MAKFKKLTKHPVSFGGEVFTGPIFELPEKVANSPAVKRAEELKLIERVVEKKTTKRGGDK